MSGPNVELSCVQEKVKILKNKWYKNNWVILFFTLVIPPLGIYLMLKYQNTWSSKYKAALSAMSITLFLGCILCGFSILKLYSPTPKETLEVVKLVPLPTKILPIPSLKFSSKDRSREKVSTKKRNPQTVQKVRRNSVRKPKKNLKSRSIKSARKIKTSFNSLRLDKEIEKPKEKNEEKFNETKPLKDSIPSNDLNSISEPTIGKGTTVYVTDKGKCYHFKKCRRGSNYHAVTLEEAEEKGLKPCKKCTKQS